MKLLFARPRADAEGNLGNVSFVSLLVGRTAPGAWLRAAQGLVQAGDRPLGAGGAGVEGVPAPERTLALAP